VSYRNRTARPAAIETSGSAEGAEPIALALLIHQAVESSARLWAKDDVVEASLRIGCYKEVLQFATRTGDGNGQDHCASEQSQSGR
jgi:hypothetical protein